MNRDARSIEESLSQARVLFASLTLDKSNQLLIERSFLETSAALRRCAWLFISEPRILESIFLSPMKKWGASLSYSSLREYERAIQLSRWVLAYSMPVAPFLIFRKGDTRPPARWRWTFLALMLAGSPLSFFVALAGAQILGYITESSLLLLACSLLFPLAFGKLERQFFFKRWPWLNPARHIVSRWFAPDKEESERCTHQARDCFALQSLNDSDPNSHLFDPRLVLPTPRYGLKRGDDVQALELANYESLFALTDLAERMAREGRDPGTDAALMVLAENERKALIEQLDGANNTVPLRPRSRSI
jgi:hypothetical protein